MSKTKRPFSRFAFLALLVSSVLVGTSHADDRKVEPRKQMPESLIDKDSKSPPLPIKKGRFMFSVTLHKREEIDSLLTRADSLSRTMRTEGNKSAIALILHGPEIKLFTRKNYKKNRDIIEKAERLDKENVIQVKVCKTKMKELGIKDEDLPSFMEIIPYAPDEEKKLLGQGYVYF
ncbi:MAG: DsrE family protein [Acidiferrobacterales bacterium]